MKKLLLAALLLSLSVPTIANAQTTVITSPGITTNREIIMSPLNTSTSTTLTQLGVVSGSPIAIHLVNPSPQGRTFSIPDLDMNVLVPPNSERMVYLDAATLACLTPGQPVAYHIDEPCCGERLASNTLLPEQTVVSQLFQQENFLTAKYDSPDIEPEYTQNIPSSRAAVRGYW